MATAASSNLRERITFTFNLPVDVTLESDGTEQAGRDGTSEYRYFVDNRRIMWVPPDVHSSIERAVGAEQGGKLEGETYTITRRKTGKTGATWEVIHHADEARYGYGQPSPGTPPPAPQQQPAASRTTSQAPPAPQQPAAAAAANGPMSNSLYTALCAAIRTAAAAEKFSAEIGRPVAFNTADIRAMAATLFIHQEGGAR